MPERIGEIDQLFFFPTHPDDAGITESLLVNNLRFTSGGIFTLGRGDYSGSGEYEHEGFPANKIDPKLPRTVQRRNHARWRAVSLEEAEAVFKKDYINELKQYPLTFCVRGKGFAGLSKGVTLTFDTPSDLGEHYDAEIGPVILTTYGKTRLEGSGINVVYGIIDQDGWVQKGSSVYRLASREIILPPITKIKTVISSTGFTKAGIIV